MIHVFLGTKAQLIKMAPVMVELQNRGIPYNFVFSGQHQATVDNIREEFDLKEPDITLYSGRDITGILQMLLWGIRILFFTLRNRDKVWQGDKGGIVLNHGDTFSTLLGSLLARLSGQRPAHVESGLRSFNLLHPFPEELTRIITFHLSSVYFAPGQWALGNLQKYRGTKVDTVHNTLLDALRISESAVDQAEVDVPEYEFAVVSLHRFENIFSASKLREIVRLLLVLSERTRLLFILHKPTKEKLLQYNMLSTLESAQGVELRPRYSYFQFIKLVRKSSFVITDGGSNQEECYYMGKPCVLMRATSERQEGLGENAMVSNYSLQEIEMFLDDLSAHTLKPKSNDISPAKIIVDKLVDIEVNGHTKD